MKRRRVDCDRMIAICKIDQGEATNDDVEDDQAPESEAVWGAMLISRHASFAIVGGGAAFVAK
jgi:hypothetical protein